MTRATKPQPKYLAEMNLDHINLATDDFTEADLHGANLHGGTLQETKLAGADLRGADLTDTNLTASDLRGADLTDADLTGSDLRGADLTGANPEAACSAADARFGGVTGLDAAQRATLTRMRAQVDEASPVPGE